MDAWLAGLEQLGLVKAVKTSFFAYPLINAMHIASIGALLTSVVLMDLRLLGRFGDLPEQRLVELMRRLALGGFVVAAMTGAIMFAVRASDYAATPLYWAKMGLIILAGLNFLVFLNLDRHRAWGAELSGIARLPVLASLILWPCVLIAGRFLGFV
ncbi:MAG: DUF6644 family protein [Rhizobiaceae bacterium]